MRLDPKGMKVITGETYDLEVAWKVNKLCNFDCPYCYDGPEKRKNTSAKYVTDIDKIIDSFNKTGKNLLIKMAGGEPFVFPEFIRLCAGLTKNHYIAMDTNLSSPLVYRFAEEISPSKVKYICCSLHIPEIERLELKKDFINKITILKEKGFSAIAHVVMWPPVFEKFPEIYKEFQGKGIHLRPIGFKGVYNGDKYPVAYKEEEIKMMRHYADLTEKSRGEQGGRGLGRFITPSVDLEKELMIKPEREKTVKDIFGGYLSFKGVPCLAGKAGIRVSIEGDAKRCVSESMDLGNLYKRNMKILDKPLKCNSEICKCYFEGLAWALGDPKVIRELPSQTENCDAFPAEDK